MSNENIPTIGLKKGYFISFEGSDGAGKSTQIDLLRQALQHHGFTVRMIREPGGTKIGEKLRDILKDPKNKNLCPEAELLLMNASRAQLVREVIKPALEAGEIVLCDRYYHSTVIYQGFGRQLDPNIVRATIQLATEDVLPDVTFVLFLTAEEAKKRCEQRNDTDTRFEEEDKQFKERIQQGIDWLIAQESSTKGKIVAINSDNTKENIHNEIYKCCVARIGSMKEGQLQVDPGKKIIGV